VEFHAQLRKLGAEEFNDAHRILVDAADWLIAKGIRQWTTTYSKDLFRVCQEKDWNYGLIVDGQLAVTLTLSWEVPAEWSDCFRNQPVWWLSKLATAQHCRGQGLGARAVREVILALSAKGAEHLFLDCVYGRGFLVDFYRQFGFTPINRRQVEFSTGTFDMVLMQLELVHGLRTSQDPNL
jgi:predicted N-acetyltransferase YhbS